MDDPWADPWDDSKKPAPAAVPVWDPPPSLSTVNAQEPVSSWVPQETVSWTAPATQPEPPPSWGGEDSWSSPQSTLNGSVNAPIALHTEDDDEDHSTPDTTASPASPVDGTPEPSFAAPLPIGTPSRTLTPLKEPQDLDADGFGGFETGLDSATEDNPGWLPESDSFSETKTGGEDVWGHTWGGSASEEEEHAAQPDEWEAARLQKEEQEKQKQEQDKHVPPELLDHILAQFKELSADLWKDDASNSGANDTGHRMYDPQSMNLNSCQERIVPEQLSLSLPVPYPQTFAYKGLVEAMKLTRHTLMTRKGPMAMYMSSKGSTSWEASVRARTDSLQADAAPPGWKTVPRTASPAPEQMQKRTSSGGGILSFFTRKASSGTETPQRTASPARSIASSIKVDNNSPRPSIDVASLSASSIAPANGNASSPATSIMPSTTVLPQSPSGSVFSPTTSKGLDIFPADETEEAPPPSTMSRFLSRFTRSSRTSVASQHESLSLSADDLEFLSDVVPTSKEDVREDTQLQALSNMIKSPPLPTTLPSPLAPPPRSSQPRPPLSNRLATAGVAAPTIDDPFSIFDSPALPGKPVNPDKQLQPLPSIPAFNSARNLSASTSSSVASLASTSSTSFNDFFSSPPPPLAGTFVPAPIPPPKLSDTFVFPGPSKPSTTMSPPPQSTSIPGFLPPPPPANRSRTPTTLQNNVSRGSLPNSRSSTPSSFISPPSQPTIDEDDEFSDFITSPTTKSTNPSQMPSLSAFVTPAAKPAPASTTTTASANNLFDDFDDFFTPKPKPPPPSTTQPMPMPAKALGHTPSSSISSLHSLSSSPSSVKTSSPRVSRAQHQKTLSLLETVATRGDKWLSPPSPLPVALPPPNPSGKAANNNNADLLGSEIGSNGAAEGRGGGIGGGGSGGMQAQQAQAMAFLAPPPSSSSSRMQHRAEVVPAPPVAPAPAPVPQSFGGWSFAPPPPPAVRVSVAQAPTLAPSPPPASNPVLKPVSNTRSSAGFGFGGMSSTSTSPPPPLVSHKPTSTSTFTSATFSSSPAPAMMAKPSSTTGTTAKAKGGLSAQDLAFFEGL